MSSEEVVLSNPAEQVFVHLNYMTHEALDVDDPDRQMTLLAFRPFLDADALIDTYYKFQ